jgi:class 3 adenylate cyclase
MGEPSRAAPSLPEHPELRDIASALESAGMIGEILDSRFRSVYLSTQMIRLAGMTVDEAKRQYGRSLILRGMREDSDIVRVEHSSGREWFFHNAPIMRRYLDPADPDFDDIFGTTAPFAAAIEPSERAPRAWYDRIAFPSGKRLRFQRSMLGDQNDVALRVNDDAGTFIGVLLIYRSALPEELLLRLGRGDAGLFERMDRVSEPARRPAAILFADLEASTTLSRRLSSRGYFEVIRELTDLIDSSVVAHTGIPGKHAGDGGSALFIVGDFAGSESATARAAVDTARAIRAGAEVLGSEDVQIKVNVGIHWGATLMVGQVSTGGRLEVTALGDQMNECARIQSVASNGTVLASKELIERLDTDAALATDIDADSIAYTPVAEFDGANDKAIRDAGSISVAAI